MSLPDDHLYVLEGLTVFRGKFKSVVPGLQGLLPRKG
jgi:hypothetical protein